MHRTKYGILIAVVFLTCSCINPFDPGIDPQSISKYVVNGLVSDENDLQVVTVSRASDVGAPELIPVPGCSIVIKDGSGNTFRMDEAEAGVYKTLIGRSLLIPGSSFSVEITAPDGTRIISDYDTIADCPDIDSVYYLRRDINTGNLITDYSGIQFYLDFEGSTSRSRYFRYELTETWEYRVPLPREWYYDGEVHHIIPPDYSRQVCWLTVPVKQIFTLATTGLSANRYEMLPLNFVDNLSARLVYGYSLLVRQLSLSEAAFIYWDQLRNNSYDQGGLYDRQPGMSPGNLHIPDFPEREVLGFFQASSVKTKRIFVQDVENLDISYVAPCSRNVLRMSFRELKPGDLPVYLFGDRNGFSLVTLGDECVDCLKLGGINVKPEFWPW